MGAITNGEGLPPPKVLLCPCEYDRTYPGIKNQPAQQGGLCGKRLRFFIEKYAVRVELDFCLCYNVYKYTYATRRMGKRRL